MTTYEHIVCPPLALTLAWEEGEITTIGLAWAGDGQAAARPESAAGRALAASLARYLAGGGADWPELPLAWERMTPFRRKVMETLARLPAGEVTTYGGLARTVGRAGAARAVGRVMATNPWPLIVPCHRVVGTQGLTGFGPGLPMKRFLLELEGVELPPERG